MAATSPQVPGRGRVAFYLMAALNTHLRQSGWLASARGCAPPTWRITSIWWPLGTVADVVALDGNNRILVHQGLQRIRAGRCRPGIQALVDVSGRDGRRLCAADLGFALGPRLNAVGRLDDMSSGSPVCSVTTSTWRASSPPKWTASTRSARRSSRGCSRRRSPP